MRKVILCALALVFGLLAAGCERNDYQHPMYRSTKNKEDLDKYDINIYTTVIKSVDDKIKEVCEDVEF